MAKQLYYQNLPIPSNTDNIPTYLNNELQIIGNVIAEINDQIGTTSSSTSLDNEAIDDRFTIVEDRVDVLEDKTVVLNNQITDINKTIDVLEQTTTENTTAIDELQFFAVQSSSNIDEIANISNDNIISQSEKSKLFQDWKEIYTEYTKLINEAATYTSVSTSNYTTAYGNLRAYLTSEPIYAPASPLDGSDFCANPQAIPIDGVKFRNLFIDYYLQKTLLVNSFSGAAKSVGDSAVSEAIGATMTAESAAADAAEAMAMIDAAASDNVISQGEKSGIFIEWKSIYDEKAGITAQGTNSSVSTTNYTNAYNTLATYLTSAPISIDSVPTDGAAWCSNTTSIPIVGTTFRTNFANYYNQRQLLLNAVSTAIKTTSDTASSTANTALSNANTALSQANTAISGLADKLSKTANGVLSGSGAVIAGSLVINSSGQRSSGSGVALTSAGIAGFNSAGNATFAIDTNGTATFAGALSAASGTFAGTLSSVNGTFTGSLSAVNGSFTGNLVGASIYGGNLSITTSGSLSSGMTNYATGTGYWMDYNAGTPRFSVGTGSAGTITNGLSWNGSTATFAGNLLVSGTSYATSDFLNSNTTASQVGLGNVSNLSPQNQAQTGLISGTTITGGGITFSSGGTLKGGKTSFSDTTNAGFILGYGAGGSANQYGFKFGNADMSKGIYWDGSTLAVKGDITGSTGTFSGALSAATGSFAGSLTVGSSPVQTTGPTMTGTGAVFNSNGTFAIGNSTTNIAFDNSTMKLNGNVVATANINSNAVTAQWTGSDSPYIQLPTAGATATTSTSLILMPADGTVFLNTLGIVHNNSTSTASLIKAQAIISYSVYDSNQSLISSYGLNPFYWQTVQGGGDTYAVFGPYTTYAGGVVGSNGSMVAFNALASFQVTGGNYIKIEFKVTPATTQTTLYYDYFKYTAVLYKR